MLFSLLYGLHLVSRVTNNPFEVCKPLKPFGRQVPLNKPPKATQEHFLTKQSPNKVRLMQNNQNHVVPKREKSWKFEQLSLVYTSWNIPTMLSISRSGEVCKLAAVKGLGL